MKNCAALLLILVLLAATISPASADPQSQTLQLSEVLASSSSKVFQDANGNSPDWVEIHNTGTEPVSLKGLCLSDSTKQLDKFVFPDLILPANGYLLVLCSGEDRITEDELHTSFKLSADGETVVLSWKGQVLDKVKTGRQAQNVSLARNDKGKWEQTHTPTPGHANVISALRPAAAAAANYPLGAVQINEVVGSSSPYRDYPGYDYVELYNSGSMVSLSGWTLTLSGKEEKVFAFPKDASIGKDKCLAVYFTDQQSILLTTGFSIPASYGALTLKNARGEIVDVISWSEPLYGNIPYGRPSGSRTVCYLEQETRGSRNPAQGYAVRADAPKFSKEAGFYTKSIKVEIKADRGQTIYYTTDGSAPTRSSKVYTTPLQLSATTVLRAAAASDTAMLSEIASATYFFGLEVRMPVVSVMINHDYLRDPSDGMMAADNYRMDWEYPAQVEYFSADGSRMLNQQAGVAVSGEVSRQYSQKSLAFFARKAYGSGVFTFNPFPHRDYESVSAFVLRNGGSEGLYTGVRFKDLLLTRLALTSHAPVADGQPVLVFINGELWGHCNLRERVNKDYFAAREGITDEDLIDQIDILNDEGTASNGRPDDYTKLSSYMARTDLNDPDALAYVLTQLDVDSLFDYAAYSMICGNKDLSNTRFYRVPGGKWTWTLYDLDNAMGDLGAAPITYFMQPASAPSLEDFDHVPFSALMQVPAMRDKFLRRMGEIMAEQFTFQALSAAVDQLYMEFEPIMAFHVTRWSALTMDSWTQNVDHLRQMLKDRPPQVVKDVQRVFKLTDAEVQQYFGEFLAKNGQ